jgi:hypothetical protein
MESTTEPAWLQAAIAGIGVVPHIIYAAVILTIAIVFKGPVSEAIKNWKRFEGWGMRVEAGDPSQPTLLAVELPPSGDRKKLKWRPGHDSIMSVGELMKPYIAGTKPRNDDIDLALYWFIVAGFETTFRLIHGSQIRLMNEIDLAGSLPMRKARDFYNQSVAMGNKVQTFEQYLQFLKGASLVLVAPDGQTVSRTDVGHAFLEYLKLNNLPMQKPY